MSILLEGVSPSSRILVDILEFHSKNRSRFGLLSSAYLLVQRLNVLELQVNYLKCPYDVQTKNYCDIRIVYPTTCTSLPIYAYIRYTILSDHNLRYADGLLVIVVAFLTGS